MNDGAAPRGPVLDDGQFRRLARYGEVEHAEVGRDLYASGDDSYDFFFLLQSATVDMVRDATAIEPECLIYHRWRAAQRLGAELERALHVVHGQADVLHALQAQAQAQAHRTTVAVPGGGRPGRRSRRGRCGSVGLRSDAAVTESAAPAPAAAIRPRRDTLAEIISSTSPPSGDRDISVDDRRSAELTWSESPVGRCVHMRHSLNVQ